MLSAKASKLLDRVSDSGQRLLIRPRQGMHSYRDGKPVAVPCHSTSAAPQVILACLTSPLGLLLPDNNLPAACCLLLAVSGCLVLSADEHVKLVHVKPVHTHIGECLLWHMLAQMWWPVP